MRAIRWLVVFGSLLLFSKNGLAVFSFFITLCGVFFGFVVFFVFVFVLSSLLSPQPVELLCVLT